MSIIRTERKTKNFTIISNDTLQDSNISFEARGLLSYLLSKPDDWICRMADLQKNGKIGRDKARRILKELNENGYAERVFNAPESGKAGGSSWVIYEDPSDRPTEKPSIGKNGDSSQLTDRLKNRPPEKPTVGKSTPIQSTELLQSTELTKKGEREKETHTHADFSSPINASHSDDTARAAADFDATLYIIKAVRKTPRVKTDTWKMQFPWLRALDGKQYSAMLYDFAEHYIKTLKLPDNRIRQNIEGYDKTIQSAFYSMWLKNHMRFGKDAAGKSADQNIYVRSKRITQ